MLWFARGLLRRVVTTRYPRRTDAWAAALPSPPAFDSARLTPELAARLVARCPNGSLAIDGGALVLDLGGCTGCGRCVAEGDGAVRPSGVFELASSERIGLVKRIPIKGARK
jgi:ferredoxin-like protein FixX